MEDDETTSSESAGSPLSPGSTSARRTSQVSPSLSRGDRAGFKFKIAQPATHQTWNDHRIEYFPSGRVYL